MVRREFRCFGHWRGCISTGRRLLRPTGATCMVTALVCFRACLDGAVRPDGYRRVAGMAPRRCKRESHRAGIVLAPARTQCALELDLLRVALGRVEIGRASCRERV